MDDPRDSAASDVIRKISDSGLTIYDGLDDYPDLYIETALLEYILSRSLRGLNLDYQNRTKSKVLKTRICQVLGYPVPKSFTKVQPRFIGQNFDTHSQKANNLQIYNEEVSPSRRYVIAIVNEQKVVTHVKVVTGEVIAILDTTGTLTKKYQARSRQIVTSSVLVSHQDTANVSNRLIDMVAPSGLPSRSPSPSPTPALSYPSRSSSRSC